MLRALFAWVEPLVIGLVTGRQWLVLLGLCNIFIIILWNNTEHNSNKSLLGAHTFSYQKHLQHLRTQNNYFWAISFLSIIIWVVAYILETWDQYAKIALGLMTAGVAYRVVAAATHWLRNTRIQHLSKVFWLLIIVGAWWAYIGTDAGKAFFTELPKNIMNLISVPKAMAPSEWTEIKLINTIDSWDVTKTDNETPPVETKVEDTKAPDNTITTETTPTKDNTSTLTFAQVVPALVKHFNLQVPNWSINFANIASSSPLYNDFKAWYAARFFGPSINPNNTVSCNVYLVMIWLAQKRQVTYNSTNIFDAYRAAAQERNQTFGCEAGASVTQANLPY